MNTKKHYNNAHWNSRSKFTKPGCFNVFPNGINVGSFEHSKIIHFVLCISFFFVIIVSLITFELELNSGTLPVIFHFAFEKDLAKIEMKAQALNRFDSFFLLNK